MTIVKDAKKERKECSEFTWEDGVPTCKSGHIAVFGICQGLDLGTPYCMREDPPEHLYEDGLPIGWKLAMKKYKERKESGQVKEYLSAEDAQAYYEQSIFYRG